MIALSLQLAVLEGKHGRGKKCSQYMRALTATARSLNIQLMVRETAQVRLPLTFSNLDHNYSTAIATYWQILKFFLVFI